MVGGGFRNENWAVLGAFSAHHKFSARSVNVVAIEIDELRNTQSARKQKFDNCAISKITLGFKRDGFDQARNFFVMKKRNLRFDDFWQFNFAGFKTFDVAARQISKKSAQGNQMVSLRRAAEIFAIEILVAVEPEAIFADDFAGDFFDFDVFFEKFSKSLDVKPIIFDSFKRAAAFDFEAFEKIIH